MARKPKPAEPPASPPEASTRKRLTPDQKAAIVEGLAKGETGSTLAARHSVSLATIYSIKRKANPIAATGAPSVAPSGGLSDIQKRLILWASRKILGHNVHDDETADLKQLLEAELKRRFEQSLVS